MRFTAIPSGDGSIIRDVVLIGKRTVKKKKQSHIAKSIHAAFIFADRQKNGQQVIPSTMGVGCVKKNDAPVVRCEYTEAEKSLAHLIEESFRLYLARVLAAAGGGAVSRER